MSKSYKIINAELGDMKDWDLDKAYEELPKMARAFVDAYYGNIKRACQLTGMSYGYAMNLVMRNDIKRILRSRIRNSAAHQSMIATREERQLFWTRMMHDPSCSKAERMKASELLGRSYCDFSDRKIIEGGDNPLQHTIHSIAVEERIQQLRKELPEADEPTQPETDELDFI